jgi:choline transport protein
LKGKHVIPFVLLDMKLMPDRFILIIHTLGFFAVLVPLVYLAPHGDASFVFSDFIDTKETSGYSSGGLAFFVGLLSANLPSIDTLFVPLPHADR